ncbi:mechanosensitive ion channel family protein [Desulfogranum marinum]|uniref:mechanosensitive ion channel family protein n=1 Tax=Desulfogranum marinum TaxID=453220 RepID=UPI001962C99F|nr:mechanosensitive ion channel family protein [Desulfogranum marinum]MBM9514742.1 hypothetical protein [Desulfogranum marinum]
MKIYYSLAEQQAIIPFQITNNSKGPIRSIITITLCCLFLFASIADAKTSVPADTPSTSASAPKEANNKNQETTAMLTSLLELQKSLKKQIHLTQQKYKDSKSDAEKATLEQEIVHLDQQLSDTTTDFERIATGVESALFAEKKPETFSWKEELASLVEPAIKELKRFTIKARKKSHLKDKIVELTKLSQTAGEAVIHLQTIAETTSDKQVKQEVTALLPEWSNIERSLLNKLELAQLELSQLHEKELSLIKSSSNSIRNFFKNRGFYLTVALLTFIAVLITCRILYRLFQFILRKIKSTEKKRSFHLRMIDILFQTSSIVLAVTSLFFVLYLAEDWFLLSMAIIFFLGIFWTIRQGLPRLWQQGRLMLNIGSVRENERLILHGVPWKIVSIHVFCQLENPMLGVRLRIPIEDIVGLSSRPFSNEEPWFPCKKGDWVVVGSAPRGRVVSLSHEQVELVERGGKRIVYPTGIFLENCPVNLSRNFRLRVVFGLSYSLQKDITRTIPNILLAFIESQMEQEEWADQCMNLQVEFFQANASSLDLLVLADFKGAVADINKRIERAIHKWCVECATVNNWEIPFPQLTLHQADKNKPQSQNPSAQEAGSQANTPLP